MFRQVLRLAAIDSIEGLVEEQANGPTCINPSRHVLIHSRRVVEHRQDVYDNKREPAEGNLIIDNQYCVVNVP